MNVGYLLRTFPQLSQTFVNQEIEAMARLTGRFPVIAALFRPGEGIDESLDSLSQKTLYWYDIDKRKWRSVLIANLRMARKFPKAYGRLLFGRKSGVAAFLKKVYLAHHFHAKGVRHIHTHFAWEQTEDLVFIKRLTGIPFSVTLHAADIYSETFSRAEMTAEAAFLITISDYNKNYLVNTWGLDPATVHVLHCGVDPKAFLPRDMTCVPEPARADIPLILAVGRLTEKKGFDLLILALKRLADREFNFKARIVGDGPLKRQLADEIGRLNMAGRIEMTGSLPHRDVIEEIKQCCLFTLPCRRAKNGDIDGIPVVLMEAMAAGKPVVSTRISGIPELVGPACGILVEPDDGDALARGLACLLEDSSRAGRMGENGRDRVMTDFSIRGQVEGLLSLIEKKGQKKDNL